MKQKITQPKVAQFIHLEGYTVTSAVGICGEVTREKGYCPHITEQRTKEAPPIYLQGDEQSIRELGFEMKSKFSTVKRLRKNRSGKIVSQKIRENENIFLAGVTTITRELGEDHLYLNAWVSSTHDFLKEKYGENLQAVVLHSDEKHFDIHFIIVNEELDPSLNSEWYAIRKQNLETKEYSKKELSYKEQEALREFQDEYFDKVASGLGLDRVGEQKRPRQDRADYLAKRHAEQLAAKAKLKNEAQSKMLEAVKTVLEVDINSSISNLTEIENTAKGMKSEIEEYKKEKAEFNLQINEIEKQKNEIKIQKQEIEQIKIETGKEATKILQKAESTAEIIIAEGISKRDEFYKIGRDFAKKEKAHAAEAAKRNEDVIKLKQESKKLIEEQEKIVDDLKQRREKEESGFIFNVIRVAKRALHKSELNKERNFWTEKFETYKRQAEEIVTRWKNALFASQAKQKELEKELKEYKLKFGELKTPENNIKLDKNNDVNVKPDDYGSGSGGYGM